MTRIDKFTWNANDINMVKKKAGKFVTIDGQPVFIGGPGQGGGGTSGGGLGTELAKPEGGEDIDTVVTVLTDPNQNPVSEDMIQEEWTSLRRAVASRAIYGYNEGLGDLVVVQSGGEVVGIAELGKQVFENPLGMEGQYRRVPNMATKRRGFGKLTMDTVREHARDEGVGIFLGSMKESVPFYEAIGMRRFKERVYHWTPEDIASG